MKIFNKVFAAMFLLLQILHCTLNIDNCEAQWVQTNGPFGGNIYSFASKGNDNFCGSYLGGIFRTTNNGDSWTGAGLVGKWIYSIAISGDNIFAGVGNYFESGGVLLSTNNGENWVDAGLSDQSIRTLVINEVNLFAVTWELCTRQNFKDTICFKD